jgi:formiminoglutamase
LARRNDGDSPLHHRIFQRVEISENYENISPNNFVIQGFAVDEGVRRNKGRVGAAKAPDIIRKNMSNFPVVSPNFKLLDFGNITCEDQNLEKHKKICRKSFNNSSKKRKIHRFRRWSRSYFCTLFRHQKSISQPKNWHH